MIELYTWPTPNGVKVQIALEELELDYRVAPVDIGAGDQFDPAYLELNPNNKIPTIVDRTGVEPVVVFESGAILIYLAEKTGRLIPDGARLDVIQWLMFQMGGVGPMLGQCHHFRHYAPEKIEYAIWRYTSEARRLYGVLDRRLAKKSYLAGEYSIADIATWPWIRSYERQGLALDDFEHVRRWFDAIAERPAVRAGIKVLADKRRDLANDPTAQTVLFGAKQFERG